jgi:hypothetical protein
VFGAGPVPDGFTGRLEKTERVLASAELADGAGVVLLTQLGLWLPEGRRVGWHLVSKATWGSGVLVMVEAREDGELCGADRLTDLPPVRLALAVPGRVPELVHQRVTSSIKARERIELPSGGAWVLQRSVPGRDGLIVQVRPDSGTDDAALRTALPDAIRTLRENTT